MTSKTLLDSFSTTSSSNRLVDRRRHPGCRQFGRDWTPKRLLVRLSSGLWRRHDRAGMASSAIIPQLVTSPFFDRPRGCRPI